MRNGASVNPLAIGTSYVLLPSGHVLRLKDCLCVPNAIWNVVSISRLIRDNYKFSFVNNVLYSF